MVKALNKEKKKTIKKNKDEKNDGKEMKNNLELKMMILVIVNEECGIFWMNGPPLQDKSIVEL